jgi:hypothetical protein
MRLKDVLKDESTSEQEYKIRRDFYRTTANAPIQDSSGDTNPISNSTHFDDIAEDGQDYFFYSRGKSTIEEETYNMKENKERDKYLELGLESFDIFDD